VIAEWAVRLDSPTQVLANLGACILWLWAIVDVFNTRRREWHNPRGKVFALLTVLLVSAYVGGVYVPIGPLLWLCWWRARDGLGLRSRADRRRGVEAQPDT
jgi:hypothetical protein